MTDQQNETSRIEDRVRRADIYFETHLRGQRKWYSEKAGTYKSWYRRLADIVLVCGALTSALQLLTITDLKPLLPWITAVLGMIVTVAKGLDQIVKPGETWLGYRKASEGMKREYRLYINSAGPYGEELKETQAYALFVEQIERIISEEQQVFWPRYASPPAAATDEGLPQEQQA